LVKNFENVVNRIQKKPTTEAELVDLEATVESFRSFEMKTYVEEFLDLLAWQALIFQCGKWTSEDGKPGLRGKDFQAIWASADWVHRIEGTVEDREHGLKAEREALENKFKEQRSKFLEDLRANLQLVLKFKDCGNLRQVDDYLERIQRLREQFARHAFEADKLHEKEEMLGWEATMFDDLHEAKTKLEPYAELWQLVYEFEKSKQTWTRGPLFQLNPAEGVL